MSDNNSHEDLPKNGDNGNHVEKPSPPPPPPFQQAISVLLLKDAKPLHRAA